MLLTQLVPSAAADREGDDYPGHSPDEKSGQATCLAGRQV
ncbi:hypothetical protein CLV31_104120 [Algoriphagus aquaeductus]|uniref:Uncharacterized protein n=1 Tax=Algoriphagus aquaeductus TaxID=475299 RepID=A0A326RTE0_9BACT|nr:hypothetical protein CLV31_104120 [Algoriphagus aquaeductus]